MEKLPGNLENLGKTKCAFFYNKVTILRPSKTIEKMVTEHQIPDGASMIQRTVNEKRWCQYGTKDIKCQVLPVWYKGHKIPGGAKMAQVWQRLVLCDSEVKIVMYSS